MLTKRIVPCLDIRGGRTVKGIEFESIRDAGDPVELAARYNQQGADELVLLDISATVEERQPMLQVMESVARQVAIPFTVGGGIDSEKSAYRALRAGADKVAVNSAALRKPRLLQDLNRAFGQQCVVLAVDAKPNPAGQWEVFAAGGRQPTGRFLQEWVQEAVDRGIGEVLFTAMNKDGTRSGFALEALAELSTRFSVPLIASGGAGRPQHFQEVFTTGKADAALAASIFHYGDCRIPNLKEYLLQQQIAIRP
ncbi:MAG: imidazole glycerol phosphate synthase subunit HisF [Salibacteraceae bacterium]